MLMLDELVKQAHGTAVEKGWWDGKRDVPGLLMLVVSELSEALECYRDGESLTEVAYKGRKPVGFAVEIADAVIRIADLCGELGIDLDTVLQKKLSFNRTRPYRHGGKLA